MALAQIFEVKTGDLHLAPTQLHFGCWVWDVWGLFEEEAQLWIRVYLENKQLKVRCWISSFSS